MAVKTTLEQLEEVQAAITALLTGALEYRMGDVTVERQDLDALQTREDRLLARYNRENRGGPRTRPNFTDGI
jgi:hypothetical protein